MNDTTENHCVAFFRSGLVPVKEQKCVIQLKDSLHVHIHGWTAASGDSLVVIAVD